MLRCKCMHTLITSAESKELTPLDDSESGDTIILKFSRNVMSIGEMGDNRQHPSNMSLRPDNGNATFMAILHKLTTTNRLNINRFIFNRSGSSS